ncbi:ClbS/DfsB family four-helix bundle protein [Vagococcus hydrophili]|uniref:ClbS/DfsB family four-helix bundle protein n=1 Tax=Vagococcus hydrophili TaxID=2714947 RepID=A0A6G8ASL8_9ENTE|nr:ClbS/DfsB family four-helix bundle protein [Vagococcus hydrophili]QIL47923.1 ClbS/DfsB family four-helix bundle protein [Vagococcus hydrophili]
MARAKNKEELLLQGEENYQKLMTLIDSLSEEEQVAIFPFEGRDRQIRDCLVHLYEWHQLFLDFVNNNQQEAIVPFLPVPYNWKNYGEMNIKFWEKHQNTSLENAKNMLETSHNNCLDMIKKYSDEELFTKKYYNWTGTTSLGSYGVSATASHYDWALKTIRKYKRSLK